MSNEYDEKVNRLVLAMFVEEAKNAPDWSHEGHLVNCGSLKVADAEAKNGTYGCDTGCEYMDLTAQLVCEHEGFEYEFSYGGFGMISDLLDDLEEMENAPTYKDWVENRSARWDEIG